MPLACIPMTEVYGQYKPLLPVYIKTQFAGDIGLISVGVGKSLFNDKLETDLFFGYLPKSIGGDRIFTSAIKVSYLPFREIPIQKICFNPLSTGLQLGYTFGDEYFAFEPRNQYPKSYYGFSTALHLYYFVGGRVSYLINEKIPEMEFYYEVGSNVEYIISYIQNPHYLSLGKIFNLGMGVKINL